MSNTSFNDLSDAEVEALALLAEEAGELVQAVGKILRHGMSSRHPSNPSGANNRERLEREIGDVIAAFRIAVANGVVNNTYVHRAADDKMKRVAEYLHHARMPA